MDLKEKLADAHNNFPIIESHPAMLYADALNRIIELEEKLAFISGWLCENVECKKFDQILEWGKATDALLEKAN